MVLPRYCVDVAVFGLFATKDVVSFSIRAQSMAVRPRETKTTLFAGFATGEYLNNLGGLSELTESTKEFTKEDFWNSLSGLDDAPSVLFGSSSFHIADAISPVQQVGEASTISDVVASAGLATDTAATGAVDTTKLMSEASGVGTGPSADTAIMGISDMTVKASAPLGAFSETPVSAEGVLVNQGDISASLGGGKSLADIASAHGVDVSKLFEKGSATVQGAAGAVQGAGGSLVEKSTSTMHSVGGSLVEKTSETLQGVGMVLAGTLEAEKSKLIETGTTTLQAVGEIRVSDMVDATVSGLQFLATKLLEVINAWFEIGSGKTLTEILESAQASVNGAVGGAVHGLITTVNEIGEKSIAEAAQSFVAFVVAIMKTLTNPDALVEIGSGKPLMEMLDSAQASVNGVVDSAVQAVATTAKEMGEHDIGDALQSFVSLVVAVVKILFQMFSAVVQVFSGKSVAEWALDANDYIAHEASRLTAEASAVATGLAEKSLSELATMMSSFLQLVENLIMQGFNGLGESVITLSHLGDGSSALHGIDLAGNSIESVSTALSSLTTTL